jgi:formimidoylglutamate deiminase
MKLFADHALLPDGWTRNVTLLIGRGGTIDDVVPDASPLGATRLPGPVIPGMPNLHSHAFQRALAGRTGHPMPEGSGGDSFWTWRTKMYACIDRMDADAFEAIALQAYVEMLKAGYTAVAEFHYIHHDPQGWAYSNPAELALRVANAAYDAGIAPPPAGVLRAFGFAAFRRRPASEGSSTASSFSRLLAAIRRAPRSGIHAGCGGAQPARSDAR